MDSKLRTIEKNAFCWSSIKTLTIPSNLIELKTGWCYELRYLTEIYVSPKNPRYSIIEGKMIVGKSSLELDEYDTIEFCSRNAKRIKIPNYIKKIESYAFSGCSSLVEVEFPIDSKLQIINKNAFSETSIYSLTIPSYVTKICKNAFSNCLNLAYVDVAENSQLKTIEKKAFSFSKIEKFSIPSSLIELEEEWCSGKNDLVNINISENNPYFKMHDDKLLIKKSSLDSNVFDSLCVCLRNADKIKIPNFIKTIESFAFYSCDKLFQVEIPEDSQLEKIIYMGLVGLQFKSLQFLQI